jgi:hypothetical protein
MRYVALLLAGLLVLGVAAWVLVGVNSENGVPEPSMDMVTETTELQQELDQAEATRIALVEELAQAKERIEELETEVESASVAQSSEEAIPEETEVAEEESSDEDKRDRSLGEIRSRMEENPMAKAQIQALTELVYGDFVNGVTLEPDVKAEVRKLLGESNLEYLALTQYAMQAEDVTWREMRGWQLEERAFLNDGLREVLPKAALPTWNAFAEDIDARFLDGNLRNQIRAFASGLTPENFESVMDVAVEEFRAEQAAMEESDELYSMETNVLFQLRAMETMRERLEVSLSEDQYAELENFLTMADNVLRSQLPKEEEQ